jgi:hypothetical protein
MISFDYGSVGVELLGRGKEKKKQSGLSVCKE